MSDSGFQQSGLSDIQQRLVFLKVVVLVVISLLTLRLWQLQVRDGPHYLELSQDNRTSSILLHPARGLIYDRNGILLANNVPSFNLYVELKDVKDREGLIQKLVEYLNIDASEVSEKIRTQSSRTRVKLKGSLTLREAALIESHRLALPGVVVQPEFQRNNPQGPYAAHVVGYVGEVSERQMSKEYFEGLRQGSIVGQYGIEREYDQLLRGQAGSKLIEVDALGHEKRTISVDKPQAGHDLYLTIDFDLQQLAEDLLGVEAGAIVALDPKTGETLALASRPSFDPNALSRGLRSKNWQDILRDKRHPLTNRAIQGLYPPGSTFKIIMAAAALESNTVDISETIQCGGRFRFGNRTYRDWKASGHGTVDLHKAMMHSCDVYFYKMGHRLGIETIATYAKLFGLGKKTGIDLPSEQSGIVPSAEWKQKARGEPWYPGETISVSIGQGFVNVTPLQMAQVIATISNNGVAHQPRLIRGVRHRNTGQIETWPIPQATPLGLNPTFVEGIQRSLASVVSEGTARRANSPLVTIAGKTGTSQVVALRPDKEKETPKQFRDHAWFVAYAPFDNPQIAVAVLAEHSGHGGSAAAPLARELIEAFIKKNRNPVGESRQQRENTKRPVL
ncbi:MAG: penicillin-binding protein 2 [Nitrospirae bacterium]|nr:penicillin-binding protein 2 [Nitrospirota bacterium]MDA1303556.1 penicillin-binding protein 2 [Nitrospirota bacterium]